MSKIIEFLTTENKDTIASDLVDCMKVFKDYPPASDWRARMAFPGRAEYEFELSKVDGSMKNEKDANTFLSFDLEDGTIAKKFLKLMFEEDISEEEEVQLRAFLILVANEISDSYSMMLRETIRQVVLPDSVADTIPLHPIKILNIELVDYSSICEEDRHLSRFKKTQDSNTDMQRIHQYILSRSNEVNFDKDGNPVPIDQMVSSYQIAKKEIEEKNPIFDGIFDVELGEKYMWDASLSFYVDYSPSDKYVAIHKGQ